MIPLKLTSVDSKEPIYINPNCIVSMRTVNPSSVSTIHAAPHTKVMTPEGYIFTVVESPEEITAMIREQQNQVPAEAPVQEEPTRRTRKERTEENSSPEEE